MQCRDKATDTVRNAVNARRIAMHQDHDKALSQRVDLHDAALLHPFRA